ncbi:MAG: hypothetical protein RIR97_934, partial [Pseudomonadota bacterium]
SSANRWMEQQQAMEASSAALAKQEASKADASPKPVSTPGKISIPADSVGQFSSAFKLNGQTVIGMVDTGATYVAINESIARQIGIPGHRLHYDYDVNTANGKIKAAHIMLDRVEIGTLKVRNVEAFVLKDKSLDSMLIGMSFLQKLKSFTVKDGTLVLAN